MEIFGRPAFFRCPVCGVTLCFWSSVVECHNCGQWIMISDSSSPRLEVCK